jgi:hypothetical protein
VQQNWGNPSGNDLDAATLLLPLDAARNTAARGVWAGGVNASALSLLEERAFGWFRFLQRVAPPAAKGRLALSRAFSGTGHGLAKFPYLRDTRRAVGLGGFALQHAAEVA